MCDLLIRSYWRDFPWLDLCVQAIEAHCVGFRDLIVVIPEKSVPWLRSYGHIGSIARVVTCPDYPDDYLGQQVSKLHADQLTDAELICHVDSDCIFSRRTCPEDLAPGGRPRIFTRPQAELARTSPWRQPTAEFLGWMPTHDFMQLPPFTYPAWLYPRVREWSVRRSGVDLTQWVLSRPPRGFSEFNVLGAFAYEQYRDDFVWVRAADIGAEEATCRWYWSRDGVDEQTRREVMENVGRSSERHHG